MNIKLIFLTILFTLSFIPNSNPINWRKGFGMADACLLVNFTAVLGAFVYNEFIYRKLAKKMNSALYYEAVQIDKEYEKKSKQIAAFVLLNGLIAISIHTHRPSLR